MTIAEMEDRLPAGFHDAKLLSVAIDYEKSQAEIEFDLWTPTDEEIETYARAKLTLSELQYFIIEPPAMNEVLNVAEHDLSSVDGFVTAGFPGHAESIPQTIAGKFAHSLFVFNWNSSIHLAAGSAELEPTSLIEEREAADQV